MRDYFVWTTDGVNLPALNLDVIESWIDEVALNHGKKLGALSYIFCDDEKILEVNRKFLNHDYYTDIITFDYTRGSYIRGDMFISLDTVESNAISLGVEYRKELLRVIIHGILHLCGINDKGPGEREIMEANENAALSLISITDAYMPV